MRVIDPELKWLSDFDVAKNVGMAVEVQLTDDQYDSGFEYVVACGIRDDLTPADTKGIIEKLFESHHYTDGLSFLEQGTPTNLSKDPSDKNYYSSARPDAKICRSVEFSSYTLGREGVMVI